MKTCCKIIGIPLLSLITFIIWYGVLILEENYVPMYKCTEPKDMEVKSPVDLLLPNGLVNKNAIGYATKPQIRLDTNRVKYGGSGIFRLLPRWLILFLKYKEWDEYTIHGQNSVLRVSMVDYGYFSMGYWTMMTYDDDGILRQATNDVTGNYEWKWHWKNYLKKEKPALAKNLREGISIFDGDYLKITFESAVHHQEEHHDFEYEETKKIIVKDSFKHLDVNVNAFIVNQAQDSISKMVEFEGLQGGFHLSNKLHQLEIDTEQSHIKLNDVNYPFSVSTAMVSSTIGRGIWPHSGYRFNLVGTGTLDNTTTPFTISMEYGYGNNTLAGEHGIMVNGKVIPLGMMNIFFVPNVPYTPEEAEREAIEREKKPFKVKLDEGVDPEKEYEQNDWMWEFRNQANCSCTTSRIFFYPVNQYDDVFINYGVFNHYSEVRYGKVLGFITDCEQNHYKFSNIPALLTEEDFRF